MHDRTEGHDVFQSNISLSRRTLLASLVGSLGSLAFVPPAWANPTKPVIGGPSRMSPFGSPGAQVVNEPAYGALPVGQANYGLPAGALYVSPRGSDLSPGTAAAPLRTFARAASVVAANQTIVMRAGIYHEGRTRATGSHNGYVAIAIAAADVTVQNYPGEAVWFDGSSVVTGFVADGAFWSRSWKPFRRDPQYTWASDAAYSNAVATDDWASLDGRDPSGNRAHDKYWQFVDYANFPAAARPERLWINGIRQIQVVSLSAMGPGKFFIDARSSKLYLGQDPAGKTVEITDLQTCMNFLGERARLRGIGIRRYGASNPQGGVVKFHRPSPRIENVVVEEVAPFGIDFVGAVNNISAHDFVVQSSHGHSGREPRHPCRQVRSRTNHEVPVQLL